MNVVVDTMPAMNPATLLLGLLLAPVVVEGPPERTGWYEERVPVLLDQVERALGAREPRTVRVLLAKNEEEFRRTAGRPPEWAAAVALPDAGTLVVRLDAIGPARGTDASGVLRHELVHLLLPGRVGGVDVPLWFEEGLAQVVGGRLLRIDREMLPVTAAAGRLLPLRSLTRRFPVDATAAALAYAEGESAVSFLLEQTDLPSFLDRIRDRGSFDAALATVDGLDADSFEAKWREWLGEEGDPWWMTILGAATIPFLLFVASLLVIGAWLKVRARSRRIYDSLPE